jgi:hypothetical protein
VRSSAHFKPTPSPTFAGRAFPKKGYAAAVDRERSTFATCRSMKSHDQLEGTALRTRRYLESLK